MPTVQPHALLCGICGSPEVVDHGRIVHMTPPNVAGVPIELGDQEFSMMRCPRCAFQFKHPAIDQEQMMECYRQASAAHWEDEPDPHERRFDVLRDIVLAHSRGRRILDVGCFNGAILNYFGQGWERFGVEPSVQAARRAADRGIAMLGSTIEQIDAGAHRFDVVLMIDVVEHLIDPVPDFCRAASLLNRGGILVIGTGDTQAWSWRLQGSRYWYCSMPEHVSFFCRTTLDFIGTSLRLHPVHHQRMSHVRAPWLRRTRKAIRNLAFEAAQRGKGLGVRPLRRYLDHRSAPWWLTATDHMVHVMRAGEIE